MVALSRRRQPRLRPAQSQRVLRRNRDEDRTRSGVLQGCAAGSLRISRFQSSFAEYAELRPFIEALREEKTEQNIASLAARWKIDETETLKIARKLRDIGFFEERTSSGEITFWVPFVYRPYLAMSQGKVDQISSPELPFRA